MRPTNSTRRRFLRASGLASVVAASGCVTLDPGGDEIRDTDGDGVIDSEDYAPRDPEVQEKSDVQPSGGGGEEQPSDVLFESAFDDRRPGDPPARWTVDDRYDEFAVLEVVAGGAAGTSNALRTMGQPDSQGGSEGRWGSRLQSPRLDRRVSKVGFHWKKRNKWDSAAGYGERTPNGPSFRLANGADESFAGFRLGGGQDSGIPLGLEVGGEEVPSLFEAGRFARVELEPDFDAQKYHLAVDGSRVGTYQFVNDADRLSRAYFKVGGWGVNADSEIDQFRVLR